MPDLFAFGKRFFSPRFAEKGPPAYLKTILEDRSLRDEKGSLVEPAKSIARMIVLGYRPLTTLLILGILYENGNRPLYGLRIAEQMERRLSVPEGSFTRARYYNDRISKPLHILQAAGLLVMENVKGPSGRQLVGYRICDSDLTRVGALWGKLRNGEQIQVQDLVVGVHGLRCPMCGLLLRNCPSCGGGVALKDKTCAWCGSQLQIPEMIQ